MERFFKVRVNYKVEDPSSLTTVNKRADFIVEGVNYQDAEVSTIKMIDYFNLATSQDITYDISKVKMSVLIIDKNRVVVNEGEGEGVDELNGLCFISQSEDDFKPKDMDFGLYKTTIKYENLESKVKREDIHIITKCISNVDKQAKLYIKKYLGGDGVITNIKLEAQSSLLISQEKTYAATEFYSVINDM